MTGAAPTSHRKRQCQHLAKVAVVLGSGGAVTNPVEAEGEAVLARVQRNRYGSGAHRHHERIPLVRVEEPDDGLNALEVADFPQNPEAYVAPCWQGFRALDDKQVRAFVDGDEFKP